MTRCSYHASPIVNYKFTIKLVLVKLVYYELWIGWNGFQVTDEISSDVHLSEKEYLGNSW